MGNTNLPNVKEETFKMMGKRTAIETEMNAIIERLTLPGGPGLSGNLVDSEGFPRSDIDVHVVRSDRHRLAELRSDYNEITKKIDQNLQVLHSARLSPSEKTSGVKVMTGHGEGAISHESPIVSPAMSSSRTKTSTAMDIDAHANAPFAVVDEITDGSPSAEDGLQLGDLIVRFGNVELGGDLLPRLASEAQTNQGHPVLVQGLRQGSRFTLSVTPRTWQGRGLLGCHFRIL